MWIADQAPRAARNWTAALALALVVTFASSGGLAQKVKAPEDKPEDYPNGPHRENTFYFCSACHGFKLVAAQGMTRAQWSETLDWMELRHALPKTAGKDRTELLDYLATAFPQKKSDRGWKNPFQP